MKRLFVVLMLASASLFAQANEEHFYKLDFVVREVEGTQTISTKSYSTMMQVGHKCSLRTGAKVPVPGAAGGFTYIDIGTAIDCTLNRETSSGLTLGVVADISTLFRDASQPVTHPVIRQNRWNAEVFVPIKKATVLFTSDDPGSKRQLQLELTATSIK